MKKYWKRYVVLIIGMIIAIVTFREELYDIMVSLKEVPIWVVLIIIVCTQLYYVIDGMVTKNMVEHEHKITYGQGIACTYYCAFFRVVTLGSGSGVAQVAYLNQCGMDVAKASSIAMIQYVLQKFTIVLLGVVSYVIFYKDINVLLGDYSKFVFIGVVVAFLIITVILIIASSKKFSDIILFILRKLGNKRFKEKIDFLEEKVQDLQQSSKIVFKKKKLLIKVILINVTKLVCMFIAPYAIVGVKIGFIYSIGIFAVSHMLAGVMPAPSGYGSLDLMFVLLYGAIVGNGVAAQLIVLYRLANTIISYLIGAFVYMFAFRRRQTQEV